MEIRCANCEHVGEASVVSNEGGVALVCANCGHHNVLSVPGTVAEADAVEAKPTLRPAPAPADVSGDMGWLTKGALDRLLPKTGEGERCPKCAQLLPRDDDNCPRCGLGIVEGRRYAEGEAPWESAPEGLEGAYEQASLLWKSVLENPTDDNITKFASFAREEQLLEFGIRKLRFFLVDHPTNEHAVSHLIELGESFQAKMIVARAKAELRADSIVVATTRLRTIMMTLVLVIFLAIFFVFLIQVAGAAC